ncbi:MULTISPECIES: acyl-CoA thioesterase [unclassified Corynebacterium]|uniref:acyl-CoA thioesterase n=1 Tax=unclassified Corynebacterium TaxID=2624378 RepID=UPI0034D313C2
MFRTKIRPRYSENDAAGHINNTVYPVWFEDARRELFSIFDPKLTPNPWNLLMVRSEINFKKEVTWVDEVIVHTYVKRIGNSSISLYEELHQSGSLCATSVVTYVNVHPETRKPETIGKAVVEKLNKHLCDSRPEGVSND